MAVICDAPQGTEQWHLDRAGVISGSMFKEVRKRVNGLNAQQQKFVDLVMNDGLTVESAAEQAGYKAVPKSETVKKALGGQKVGDYTAAAYDYAFRLAVERISGMPLDEGFQTWAMRRGQELEEDARLLHEARIGTLIEQVGFVKTDDGKYGASADGFIDIDGGSEYKCLINPDQLRTVILEDDLSEFMDQMQGGMWITGRKWWHFGLYCPALAPIGKELIIHEVKRDDDYIEALERDLIEFDKLVCDYQRRIEEHGRELVDQPEAEEHQPHEQEKLAFGIFGAA